MTSRIACSRTPATAGRPTAGSRKRRKRIIGGARERYRIEQLKQAALINQPPNYPGLTSYLVQNGINPNQVLSDGASTLWYQTQTGQTLTVNGAVTNR